MSMSAITAVRDYSETSGAEYALMLIIADGTDSNLGEMRGRDTYKLARLAHLCPWDATENQQRNARRRLQRMIESLIQRGELIVITGGYHVKNAYIIPILRGERGYDPQPCDATDHDCNHLHTPLDVSRDDLAIEESYRRKSAELMRSPVPTAKNRRAAPEPPLMRPIDRPTTKSAVGAAPEPPLMRPIDRPEAAPEPPLMRSIGRTVSHSNPMSNPMSIPAASPHSSKKAGEKAGEKAENMGHADSAATPDTPPPPPPSHEPRHEPGYVWSRTIEYLRTRNLGSAALANWIVPLRLTEIVNAGREVTVYLQAPSSDHARIVEQRYHGLIANGIGGVFGLPASRVKLIVFKSSPRVSGDVVEVAQA